MRYILLIGLMTVILSLTACEGGSTGALTGRVVDGFGNPLGGDAVLITLTDNPAYHRPDQWGNFIIQAPSGNYTMRISFSNPAAGFHYLLDQPVTIGTGSRNLGTFTLLNVQNMQAWEKYQADDFNGALALFNEQANDARAGQLWLPYMRYIEGEEDQNTLLTQGVLSAENGLGWCYSRGFGNHQEGRVHFEQSMFGGYNNYDAKVGLAGIEIGDGNAAKALGLLDEVIVEPGYYDSTQIHDNVTETDLIVTKALAQFLMGQDAYSKETLESIREKADDEGNPGSVGVINMLDQFM